jgi:PAS domain S-box-containing protein
MLKPLLPGSTPPPGKRVLLVEHLPADAQAIEAQLHEGRRNSFVVQHVASLDEVRSLAQDNRFIPDVLLLDLDLPEAPGVAGVELCRSLLDAPIVVLTSLDDQAANRAVIESGAEDYLVKGGNSAALRKAVRYAMLRYERDRDARLATAVFNHAHEGMMITQPGGIIIDVNPALSRITGYSAQELIGHHPRLLLSPGHKPESITAWWKDILSAGAWQGERLNRHKDGHDYTAWESVTPCRNAQGRIVQFIGVLTDISERKRAEAQALHSTQLLRFAIEAIDEAFVLFDADDRLVFCNDKYRQLYATSSDLIRPGASFEEVLRGGALRGQYPAANGRVEDWVAERMALHRSADHRLIQRLDDGRVLRIVERKLPDGGTVGFRIEITDLVRATEEAQAANLAKSRFLAVMSHEIRTPMNGILGMAQLLLSPQLQEHERLDYAGTVLSSGQSLLGLLNDILDLSKIEAGKFQLDLAEVDPVLLLGETQALFAGAAKNKALALEVAWLGPPGRRYRSDGHRLRQMLANLLGNAIKFTSQGQIKLQASEIENSGHSALLEFAVSDTGIGIAADKLALLFKPFSQTDSSTTREFGGTGLGLSIVSSLARLLGGEVGVDSAPGQGSRFWFRVRAEALAEPALALAPPPISAARPTAAASPAPALLHGLVLVVEDNPVNRLVIQGLLARLGLTVALAHDGQQALQAISGGARPELILMDLQMPVMDGYASTAAIRQWQSRAGLPRTPIIALTADAFEEDRLRCLAAGMDDFLTKPIALDALVRALQRWLPKPGPAPADSLAAAAGPSLDRLALEAELRQLLEPLAQNKFDAIGRFEALLLQAGGSAASPQLAHLAGLAKQLLFAEAAAGLRQWLAQDRCGEPG